MTYQAHNPAHKYYFQYQYIMKVTYRKLGMFD